jgi:hypothetical protein
MATKKKTNLVSVESKPQMTKEDLPAHIRPERREDLASTFDRALMAEIHFGVIWNQRHVDQSRMDVRGDNAEKTAKKATKTNVQILQCDEYTAVIAMKTKIHKYLGERAVRSPLGEGTYAVPINLVVEVDNDVREMIAEREAKKRALCAVLPDVKANEKKLHGPLYREDNYPTAEEIMSKFYVTWGFKDVSVPNKLRTINVKMYEQQREELREQSLKAAAVMEALLRVTVRDLVANLADKLTGKDENGRPKILHQSGIDSINAFVASFAERNITNDRELATYIKDLEKLLKGVPDAEAFRGDDAAAYREKIGAEMTRVSEALDGLVKAAPVRKFRAMKAESNGGAA